MTISFSRLATSFGFVAALFVLSGCQSSGERRASDEGVCRSYGFRPGTDGFAQCLQNIDLDRSADRRQVLDGGYGFGGYGWRRRWY